jgi:hypothetical protein
MRKVVIKDSFTNRYYGYFHQWGLMPSDGGTVSCAIIENLSGVVFMVHVFDVKFINSFPDEKPKMPC